MRRSLIALAGALLLLGVALAIAAANLDSYLNANRDAIARQASAALGREVAFGEVGISLRRGLAVRVADLAVADDPAFSSDPFLRAGALEVRVRILPALRGRIEVDRVVLRSPEVVVIRTAQGLSTASLGSGTGAPAETPSEPAAASPLAVALVDIEDGTLRFVDRSARPPVESVATQLAFRASDVALGAPVAFELEAAVLGAERPNLRAQGRVEPTAVPSVDLSVELAPLDFAQALASAPLAGSAPEGLAGSGTGSLELRAKGSAGDLALEARIDARDAELRLGSGYAKPRGEPLSLALSGRRRAAELEIDEGELVAGETRLALRGAVEDLARPKLRLRVTSPAAHPASFGAGDAADLLRDLALDARLSFPSSGPKLAASLRSPSGSLRGVEYADLGLDVRFERGRLELSKLALAAVGGTLALTGAADLRAAGAPAFDAKAVVKGFRVEKLLAKDGSPEPPRASGNLDAEVALRGAGASWAAIEPTLVGGGELRAADGVLRGFNPAGEALRALVGLPLLSDRKLARLFDSHPQVFGAEDTPFERIDARFEVVGGELVARDASLVARDYDVTGKGRYAFSGRLDSSAVMAFSRELSDAVVDAERRFRFLRSPDGRVEFPVVIRGTPGEIGVQPDLAYVATSISREALGDVVERALSGKRGASGEAPGDEGEASPPASIEDVGRDLLRRGLGGILERKSED